MLWAIVAALLLSLADAFFLLVVASYIGALETIALVVVTALVGVFLVRREGRATLRRTQRRLQRGEPPTKELIDGAMILLGAGLLITPGLLTDVTGFLLVLPVTRYPLRFILRRWLIGPWIRRKIESGDITVDITGSIGTWSGEGSDWADIDFDGRDAASSDDSTVIDNGAFDIAEEDDDR